MKKTLWISLLFLIVQAISAHSKNEIQIGIAIPNSYFGDNATNRFYLEGLGRAGCAYTGVFVNYKYLFPIKNIENLYGSVSLSAFYNDLNYDIKDWYEDLMMFATKYSIPKYLNIPLILGCQYEKHLSTSLNWYGEIGAGVNMLYISKFGYDEHNYYHFRQSFKPSFKVAYKVGTGILINNKYTIGFAYSGLGSHKVDYVLDEEIKIDRDSLGTQISPRSEYHRKLKVSDYAVSVGVRF